MKASNKFIMPTTEDDAAINAGIAADPNTREMTADDFAHGVSIDHLPIEAQRAINAVRGTQKRPTKIATTIRLPSDVMEYFRSGGKGWQTRISNALTEYIATHK